jgi:nucleoside-diphosphate-sugar epimerase
VSALRPTGVYGLTKPAPKSKWFELVCCALRSEPVPSRAGTEVHGRDVADAVWRLLQAPPEQVAGRMFNCSDLLVSTRDIVEIVQRISGASGPLPERPPEPRQVMTCAGLEALGLRFGGRPLLERTVVDLVAAARAGEGPPG